MPPAPGAAHSRGAGGQSRNLNRRRGHGQCPLLVSVDILRLALRLRGKAAQRPGSRISSVNPRAAAHFQQSNGPFGVFNNPQAEKSIGGIYRKKDGNEILCSYVIYPSEPLGGFSMKRTIFFVSMPVVCACRNAVQRSRNEYTACFCDN